MRSELGVLKYAVPEYLYSITYKYSSTAVHVLVVQVHTDHCSIRTGTSTPVAGRQFFDVLLDLSLASCPVRRLAGLQVASPGSKRLLLVVGDKNQNQYSSNCLPISSRAFWLRLVPLCNRLL